MPESPARPERFVALDVHKQYVMVAAVDRDRRVVLPPRRVTFDRFDGWIAQQLRPTDAVVLEATTNAWHLVDQLEPLVVSVTVAHALKVGEIAGARVKTDARDTLVLARLLSVGMIPEVWIPPAEVRDLRALVAHRQRLIRQRTQARNRLHSVLHRHNIVPPAGALFGPEHRTWWTGLPLQPLERLRVRHDLRLLDSLGPLLAEVEEEFLRLSTATPWAAQLPFLVQLPGVGVVTALILLSAIGDITRFPAAKHLVGYAGLGARVHDSGQTHRGGRITKQGRRELRAALIEAAWVAVQRDPHWKEQFTRLAQRIGTGKAIVAMARKLLVAVWHVLSARTAARQVDELAVARKMMSWAAHGHVATRQGLARGAFVRQQLAQLGLGSDLTSFAYNGKTVRLPAAARETVLPTADIA